MPLALLLGSLITIFVIGVVAGFNLMYPAISYDGSDCCDALSRAISYIFSRPWRMGFYTTIAAAYGAICFSIVRLFVFLLFYITRFSLSLGIFTKDSSGELNKLDAIWSETSFGNLLNISGLGDGNWSEDFSSWLVHISILIIAGLVVSFVVSFYFCSSTIVYSLMRRKVDNVDMDRVYIPLGQPAPIETDRTDQLENEDL